MWDTKSLRSRLKVEAIYWTEQMQHEPEFNYSTKEEDIKLEREFTSKLFQIKDQESTLNGG